jgi:hypothetical protein
MVSIFQVVDYVRGTPLHDNGSGVHATSSTFERALEIAKDVWENKHVHGELLICEHEVDIYPSIVVRMFDHLGNPVGVDPI